MSESSRESATKNALEWTVFGICSIIVSGVLGFLVIAAFNTKEGPAKILVQTSAPVAEDGWIRVPVTVKNEGMSVASNVEVQVSTGVGDTKREAGFTVDFVPRGGSRSGSVSFKDNGEPLRLECEVLGYEEP